MPINPITKWSTGERFNEDVGNRPFTEMIQNNQEIISQNRDLVNRLSMKPLYDFRFDENRYFVDGVEADLSTITTYTRPAVDFVKTPMGRYALSSANEPSFPYDADGVGIFVPVDENSQVDNSDNSATSLTSSVVASNTGVQFVEGIDVVRFTEDGSFNETSGAVGMTYFQYGEYTIPANEWGTMVLIIKPSDNLNFLRILGANKAYIIDANTLEVVNTQGLTRHEDVSFSFIDDGFIECRIVCNPSSDLTFSISVAMSDENHTFNATVPDGAYVDVAYFGVMSGATPMPTYNNSGAQQIANRGSFSLISLTDFDINSCSMMVEYYDRIGPSTGMVSLRSSDNSSHLYISNENTVLRVDDTPMSPQVHDNINIGGFNSIITSVMDGDATVIVNGVVIHSGIDIPTFITPPDNLEICGDGYSSYGGRIKRIAIFDKALTTDAAIALTKGTE